MERRAIAVRGIVQGVGFRPFVYHLALRLELRGFVRNQAGRVFIEIEGPPDKLDQFLKELVGRPPPLAQIDEVHWEPRPPVGEKEFRIVASASAQAGPIFISPDVATCPDCFAELLDPKNRRFGYPFLNCTNCGPRLTIITGTPYDRPRTTMASFPMCEECRREYEDPRDRRFHAQPTACTRCGPHLTLLDATGQILPSQDPLADFAQALIQGKIGALKGLGGYHLACDARNQVAVADLRRRKQREEKPFAVMVLDSTAAIDLAEVGPAEQALLQSANAPIVLLRKKRNNYLAPEVAPSNPWLGVLLPYTPLHHLLMRAVGGIPLVMTSGNRSDEPIAYRDDAPERLAGIADLFLTHNRPIQVRCDDSVTRVVDGIELPIRRSRGYAPRPIGLPHTCSQPILAVGGQLKATFALGQEHLAFLSHHLGDLDHFDAYRAFERDIALYQQLFQIAPTLVAHDAHPDYASTRYAQERAAKEGIRLIAVQHHHAHLASCMAEHRLTEPVIGVSFDGAGYGADGAIWGGEFLVGDYKQFRRAAHFRYVGMPGGDRATRESWRMALAHLVDAELEFVPLKSRLSRAQVVTVERMLERRFQTPMTSSVGRLFDAVAALAGIRDRVNYEGQAAIELEWPALEERVDGCYPYELSQIPASEKVSPALDNPSLVDTRPLIRAVAQDVLQGTRVGVIARRFHSTLVEIIADVCGRLRQETCIDRVTLSGGVFLNALLTSEVSIRLKADGFRIYRHSLVPPNDGGLSLGQLAIAAATVS